MFFQFSLFVFLLGFVYDNNPSSHSLTHTHQSAREREQLSSGQVEEEASFPTQWRAGGPCVCGDQGVAPPRGQ